jgi:hypothetical protein
MDGGHATTARAGKRQGTAMQRTVAPSSEPLTSWERRGWASRSVPEASPSSPLGGPGPLRALAARVIGRYSGFEASRLG